MRQHYFQLLTMFQCDEIAQIEMNNKTGIRLGKN